MLSMVAHGHMGGDMGIIKGYGNSLALVGNLLFTGCEGTVQGQHLS